MTESLKYECPNCQSENIQKLSLAVMKGTKSGTIGSAQTALAEFNSPPKEKSLVWWSIGCALFGIASLSLNPFPIIMLFGCCLGLFSSWHYNSKEYPVLVKDWNEKWICQRCAMVFKIGGEFKD